MIATDMDEDATSEASDTSDAGARSGARRFAAAAALAFAVLLAAAGAAHAHAILDRATPAVGSGVHGSPHELALRFSEEIEPAFSTVRVEDSNGRRVDSTGARVAPADPKLLEVALPPLPPGRYHVIWRVVSVDTHVTEGRYAFDVLP